MSEHAHEDGFADEELLASVKAWLSASNSGLLDPPSDRRSASGWDEYWRSHLKVGAAEQGFADMMSSDTGLVRLLRQRQVRGILCVGNGLSAEALALTLYGFHVTALDISAVANLATVRSLQRPEHPVRRIQGVSIDADSVTIPAGALDPEWCPKIHRVTDEAPAGGGALRIMTGDFMHAAVCPGPYDAVIERRTVQLYPREVHPEALECLTARFAERGVFVSQEHRGGWRPGQSRDHYAEQWLSSHGFSRHGALSHPSESVPRLAHLRFSTG